MLSRIKKSLGRITLSQELVTAGFIGILVLIVAASAYGYTRLTSLSAQVVQLNAELASTTALFQTNIADATTSFGNALQQESQNIQNKLGGVQDQVGVIGGAVTDLTKLSKTDPELLAKYSKVFFLNENYAPVRLVVIPPQYKYLDTADLQIIPQVLSYVQKMLDAAAADKVAIYVDSAYRSFNTQTALKNQYRVVYGAGTANQFSADQGYSEHQLGTAVDLITTGTGGALNGFDTKPAYTWLLANAYRYGFVLSYPKKNGYYIFEPWHWRFVGVKLATELHNLGTYFYEMDQRTIDTYLTSFFD
ncbi:MAG: M15 family metallopeptidase [Candidatus Paceibacterota bacterium]|jgi:LAS superfamily LD-carboxypeptidase LdcB